MKTTATRIVVIVIAFLAVARAGFSQPKEDVAYSILAIEFNGPGLDSPFPSILISDSEAGANWYRPRIKHDHPPLFGAAVRVINSSLLENLVAKVDAFENSRQRHAQSKCVTTFQVSIITPKRDNSFIYNTGEAVSLLEIIRKTSSEDESLCGAIANFQDRMTPFRENCL